MNYYLYQKEETFGPFTREQIMGFQAQGLVPPETPCCQEGDKTWQTVAAFFNSTTPANGAVGQINSKSGSVSGRFQHNSYTLRRKVFSLFGGSFHIFDPQGSVVFFSRQKAFRLREDIRIYADESMGEEVLSIQARQILDFSAAYDVFDPLSNVKVGVLRRKGFSSLLRDSWQVLDANEREIGRIQEDSMLLALLRRFLLNFIPQNFSLTIADTVVAEYRQHFNPFIFKLDMNFSPSSTGLLDRRLGVAAAVLLAAIEGRQRRE